MAEDIILSHALILSQYSQQDLDHKVRQTDRPEDVNETTKPTEAQNAQLRKALEELLPQTESNVKYKYDFFEASKKYGSASEERTKRIYENAPRPPVPPLSEHMAKVLAHIVKKKYEPKASHASRDLTMSDLNTHFCKPCRRVFDGNGSFVFPMTSSERGHYYSHWDRRMLERSAKKCPMCFLLHKSLDTPIATTESIPGHYDFVEFARAKNLYGVRFSYYVTGSGEDGFAPRHTTSNVITMEALQTTSPLARSSKEPQLTLNATTSPNDHSHLNEWLHICDTSHDCTKSTQDTDQDMQFLPTRLIDVSMIDKDLDIVRLTDTRNLVSSPRYLTLSHCWGTVEMPMTLQLTRQNISALKRRIPLYELPRTFRDMILVSRSLQIQYVWIDSLCIVQDDKGDWKTEAAKMWQVYSNAYANIAATSSSNSGQGLFRERGTLTTNPCVADVREGHPLMPAGKYHCYNDAEWNNLISMAPLNKRAWVHQEWLLSDRVMHFARDQVFWECRETKASERFPQGIPSRYDTEIAKLSLGSNNENPKQRLLEIWSSIVGEYSTRGLSHLSDKLIAVSAIARLLSHKYPDAGTYVAGMWGSYIIDQLSWSASSSAHRTPEYRAPSWSWASMDGTIEPNFNWRHMSRRSRPQRSRSPVSVLNIQTTFGDDPYDSVKASTLTVETPLLRVAIVPGKAAPNETSNPEPLPFRVAADPKAKTLSYSEEREIPFTDRDFLLSFNTCKFREPFETRGRLDDDRDISGSPKLYFMPLLTFNLVDRRYDDEPPEVDEIIGLMLEPTGTEKGQFRRCGTCRLESGMNQMVTLFLCDLGNQHLEEPAYKERKADAIGLDDIVPSNWFGKDLDFVPKRFDRYVISIV